MSKRQRDMREKQEAREQEKHERREKEREEREAAAERDKRRRLANRLGDDWEPEGKRRNDGAGDDADR